MLALKKIKINEFDSFRRKHFPESDFLQSPSWGEAYAKIGFKVFYLGFYEGKKLEAVAMAIKHPAKRGTYLEIPGGPLFNFDDDRSDELFDELKDFARKEDCVFVRLRPNLSFSESTIFRFESFGLRKAPMHIHPDCTSVIDLTQSEEDILKNMRRQTRYDVRQAEKQGIKIDVLKTKQDFKDFYACQTQTAKRQGFIPSSEDFILALRESFGKDIRLYCAKNKAKEVLAYAIVLLETPTAIYIEAASTPLNRRQPGAQALQWQIIKDAKALRLERYDLFGIAPDTDYNKKHRYSGVTTFKRGFGGETVNYIPDFDLVIHPFKYLKTKVIEETRKRRRHL